MTSGAPSRARADREQDRRQNGDDRNERYLINVNLVSHRTFLLSVLSILPLKRTSRAASRTTQSSAGIYLLLQPITRNGTAAASPTCGA